MNKIKLAAMIEAAYFAALAFILDLLPSIQLAPWISISFAMLSIFVLAFRWGTPVGLLSGFLWGLLKLMFTEPAMFTPLQVIIEYFVAFAFVGFAGLFYKKIQSHFKNEKRIKALIWVVAATFLGSLARYFWHFIAGIFFWSHNAPNGTSPVIYSLVVNGIAFFGSFILCTIGLVLLLGSAPGLVFRKKYNTPIKKRNKHLVS